MKKKLAFVLLVILVAAVQTQYVNAGEKHPLDRAKSRFTKLKKIRIHYKSIGEGKRALLFIHGWTCNLTFWRDQVPAFHGKTRMVLIDLPGHGKSDKPKIAYTMDLFADAIDAVLKDAGVEKAVLAGHSMGTPVVRQYYRRFSKKTLGLIAVDGALRNAYNKERVDRFVKLFSGKNYKEIAGKIVDGMFHKNEPAELRSFIKKSMLGTPQHVMVGAFKGMMDPEVWKDDKIDVPLQAIYTSAPHWSGDYKKYVLSLAPHADFRVIKGVGHFLMMENPKAFNRIMVNFMKKNKFLE